MKSKHKQKKKQKRIKDYQKKRNMIRNNLSPLVARGMSLTAGQGLIPKSRKFRETEEEIATREVEQRLIDVTKEINKKSIPPETDGIQPNETKI